MAFSNLNSIHWLLWLSLVGTKDKHVQIGGRVKSKLGGSLTCLGRIIFALEFVKQIPNIMNKTFPKPSGSKIVTMPLWGLTDPFTSPVMPQCIYQLTIVCCDPNIVLHGTVQRLDNGSPS